MTKRTRLELTWIGKDERPRLEPRILLEDPELSYHASQRVSESDIFDNWLIFGDNLLALKALEQEFAGKVKCVFIDPPYNTGTAFEHYDDGREHSLWLTMMRDRLELLRRLLTDDGSIWITVDDNEAHYLRVLCDEIFGRPNFVANVVWQKRTSPDVRAVLGAGHDHVLVFAKELLQFKAIANKLPKSLEQAAQYRNPDDDPRGPWVSSDYTAQGYRPNQMYRIVTPRGAEYYPPTGTCWKNVESVFLSLKAEGRMWFGREGAGMPRRKTFLSESEGNASWTWWPNTEVGHTQEAKKESIALFGADKAFGTPKPERLLQRIIQIATNPGDLVLDSFAGSGTTGAVAHKMGRPWIMIELGEHGRTHIVPRVKRVVDGDDPGGVTASVNWKGGGGFRYFRLAPSLLEKDRYGNWIMSKRYNPAMLAEAVCKHEGFAYGPSDAAYWKQGQSTERDFIYVTTQTLSREQLAQLSEDVGPDRSLLVCCAAFRANPDEFANLTLKKIPHAVLHRCQWGRDDYSLAVSRLPDAPAADNGENAPASAARSVGRKRGRKPAADEPQLFEDAES